jgi:ketosteroid isomerase-like protein
MTISLPTVISDYLAAPHRRDLDALMACFTDDAVVLDEGQEWRGHGGIREWWEEVATVYEYTVDVRGADTLGRADGVQRHDVHTHLEGNFPGGTVDLTNRFALRDERIASLQIVPSEPGVAVIED